MIFSWFTSSSSLQTYDIYEPNQENQLQQPSSIPFTKEEDGWVQIITPTENDQQVPDGKERKVNEKDQAENFKDDAHDTTTTTAVPVADTAIESKKMSRQQRRYQARLAQQQALKKQKQVAGEEQLKTAMKLGQQRKSRQKQWVDKWIQSYDSPHSNSVASASSCLSTRSTSLTAGLD
ncbi:hypothetical protein BCR42DRAFT_445866 [Absidia repens]|uniref:Uncharacterized protein n=1 Tax=Absidia repens TaxID=90262 RepID=A0A1X2J310_9FUNG|nr:hypothetical protein BCR42DRAFT_445866 [Absidia repens]